MRRRFWLVTVAALIGLGGWLAPRTEAQAPAYYVIGQQVWGGSSCVIVHSTQVTARTADFVEWYSDAGVFRIYAASGVSLVLVYRAEDVPSAAATVGLNAAACAR